MGNADLVATVRAMHNVLGGTIDPHAAWLLLRGMKTLGLRVERQNKTAFEIARRFASLPLNLLPEQVCRSLAAHKHEVSACAHPESHRIRLLHM